MKNKNKIKIILNGKPKKLNIDFTVKKLTKKLKLPLNKVAIEINQKIINKRNINKILLKNNDKVEIVHFIGGG